MKLFVDASALVAIIAFEADGEALATELSNAREPIWSALSCWETVSALIKSHAMPSEVARREVERAATVANLKMVPIGEAELLLALDADRHYGKGNHAAKLNFGDCFAYACARTNNARLLYKGNDFALTDLA